MSNQTKHTPGPWHLQFSPYKLGAPIVVGPDDVEPIAYIPSKDGLDNARLIAAAPELLEALTEIHKLYLCPAPKTMRDWSARCDIMADYARKAIAKAEGRTP